GRSTLCVSSVPLRRPRCSPLFPYTTLFRSQAHGQVAVAAGFALGAGRGLAAQRQVDAGQQLGGGLVVSQQHQGAAALLVDALQADRKSTRLNSSHVKISYAVFCLKKKNNWS